jgi:hypothetical protein
MLRGRSVFLELGSDIFDGRQRAEKVNSLVRLVDVNLQFSSVRAHANVLIMIDNFNEVGIRILFQFFDDGMEDGQSFAGLLGDVAHVFAGNEMHGHGDGRGWKPHVNVGAAGAEFVDVDANHSLSHGVGAREHECAAKSESCFRK